MRNKKARSAVAKAFIAKVHSQLSKLLKDDGRRQAVVDQLGLNRGTISRQLRPNANLTLATLADLASALGCELTLTLEPTNPEDAGSKTPFAPGSPKDKKERGHESP